MKSPIFLSLLSLLVFASCQFEYEFAPPDLTQEPTPVILPLHRIKTLDSGGEIVTFTYGAKGWISKSVSSDGYKSEYHYAEDAVARNFFNADGSLQREIYYELNDKGLRVESYDSANPFFENYWQYNKDRTVSEEISHNQGNRFRGYHFYSGGNLDSTIYYQNDARKYSYHYTYYTDQLNTVDSEAFGSIYTGKESKNLIKRLRGRSVNGSIFITNLFTYTFDGQGRVATQNQSSENGTTVFKYTYY